MRFTPTELAGAFIIDLERHEDTRGYFARTFCRREFAAHGLNPELVQANCSWNARKGTLRGMHYQVPPAEETKLVRCTRGAVYDVIVDLRPESPTFLRHVGVELTAENGRQLYVPEAFAHGFLTLVADTELAYLVGEFHTPGAERGVRHDDPGLGIEWPAAIEVISAKDAAWPDYAQPGAP
jgi:dTDP-4-dehydrorhamnose 3,5-epimerase